ncbi:ATPase [Sorangium cellulosum]|uniref:SRPBCC family protein n=1 Tax=Sorangium sp. So ce185 TaxID=3133287 RepID=UPI0007791210|nr:ATPase [Sorangium cellulosum]
MPVKKDASGRRSVQAEVEVPGSPEEVWRAIATGPGISSWFVPSDVEEREGGAAVSHFGPGNSMDSVSKITAWDPPRRFAAESPEDMGPGSPAVATEWIVEARSGGSCVVRVVHSWFASTDDWDKQFEGHEQGWVAFFRILRLYLSHFRGEPSAALQVMGAGPAPLAATWDALVGQLGLAGAAEGQRVSTSAGAPPLAGVVERAGPSEHPELLLRLDEPAPGIAHIFALPMAGKIFLPIRLYLYGDQAKAAAARAEPSWQAWMAERFSPGP